MRKLIVPIITVLVLCGILFYFDVPWNLARPLFHQDIIEQSALKYNIDPLLISALIRAESHFFHKARSNRGAIGLMQLMPATARELADEHTMRGYTDRDLEKPDVNIRLGVYYLHKLLDAFNGNETLAIAAYNAGLGTVQLWYRQNPIIALEPADIPYAETRAYVDRVKKTYAWLKHVQKIKRALQKKGA